MCLCELCKLIKTEFPYDYVYFKALEIDDYPSLKEYLKSFGERLKQDGKPRHRCKSNNKWFEIQNTTAYYHEFEKEKIVISTPFWSDFNEKRSVRVEVDKEISTPFWSDFNL